MRKTVKTITRNKKGKAKEDVYRELGLALSEMYLKCERQKANDFIEEYSLKLEEEEAYVEECYKAISEIGEGKSQRQLQTTMSQLFSDYKRIQEDADSKFKIYVRGIGNAGKSTLVNTLLQVEEEQGSKTSKIPETFIIEAFSDSVPVGQALVYRIGEASPSLMTKKEAKELQQKETESFLQSELECQKKISDVLKDVYDKEERAERTKLIYEALNKTTIRQIIWGMEGNLFLKNCILADTPGLWQELRHTSQWEDVKNYEADGVLWVLSQKHIIEKEMLAVYREEMDRFSHLGENGCMIAVINVHSEDNKPGDTGWKRMMKQTKERLAEHGLLDYFQYICYVNCKKAYEGRMEQNFSKIKESNMEELLGIINTRFIEQRSGNVITDKIRKYSDYMDTLKENLESSAAKIQEMEEKYEKRTEAMNHSLKSLESSFGNDLSAAREKHEQEMLNRLEAKENELLDFMDWSRDKQKSVLGEIARQRSANKNFYGIYQHHIDKMNQEAVRLQEESVVSRYEIIGAEVYFTAHKMEQMPISIAGISTFEGYGTFSGIWDGIVTEIGKALTWFGKKETGKRFVYKNSVKPKIRKAMINSVDGLSYGYIGEMDKALEELRIQCEGCRDNSFADELGEKSKAEEMKEKLQELLGKETDFVYEEKNLKELLFGKEV